MPAVPTAIRDLLPRGNTLDDDAFARRHWLLCSLLGFHLPVLAALGLRGDHTGVHAAVEVGLPIVCLYLALRLRGRRVSSVFATAGLVACSSILVHLTQGSIEARFHVFVVLGFVALYQDWRPYLTAVVVTVAVAGLGPTLAPDLTFATPGAIDAPWRTAALQGGILVVACLGQVLFWRASEQEQRRAAALASDLAHSQGQADARASVAELFVNLARRNQALLDRQIGLIVAMEEREHDPDHLSELFQLDHLATRIRRNAESLLVLSGEEPARRWGRPVALADVVRAAVAEVEEYRRTDAVIDEGVAIAGRAVADLAHLVAELVENGLQFSPPESRVRVTDVLRPDGRCVLIVEDRGIGMSEADLDAANELVARPPAVDARLSKRLGFHVVARLAARYGLRVRFGPTPGGGVTIEVEVPADLVATSEPARNAAPTPEPPAKPVLRLVPTEETPAAEVRRRPEPPVAESPAAGWPEPAVAEAPAARQAEPLVAEAAGVRRRHDRLVPEAPAAEVRRRPEPAAAEAPAARQAEPLAAEAASVRRRHERLVPEAPAADAGRRRESEPPAAAGRPRPEPQATAPPAAAVRRRPEPAVAEVPPAAEVRRRPEPLVAAGGGEAAVLVDSQPLLDPATLPVAPRTAAAVVEPRPTFTSPSGVFGGERTANGLQKRVPKASMHPEIRQGRDAAPNPFASSTRSPAELRSMLSKFQAGQARARTDSSRSR